MTLLILKNKNQILWVWPFWIEYYALYLCGNRSNSFLHPADKCISPWTKSLTAGVVPGDLQWLSPSEIKTGFSFPIFVFIYFGGEPRFWKSVQFFLSTIIWTFSIFESKQEDKHSHSFDPYEEFARNLWKKITLMWTVKAGF